MKLKNKKTGDIITTTDFTFATYDDGIKYGRHIYNSLAEFNEEWEDYEETKDDYIRVIESFIHYVEKADDSFCCDETVQEFAEKLKALKRLKDKGFSFDGWTIDDGLKVSICTNLNGDNIYDDSEKEIKSNLDLIFGGNE